MTDLAFGRFEACKSRFLHRIDGWNQVQLAFKPDADSWCAAQVLNHLLRTEAGVLEGVKTSENLAPRIVTIRERAKGKFCTGVILLPVRVPMPKSAAKRIAPAEIPNLEADLTEWGDLTQALQAYAVRETDRRHGLFKHPLAGWMTARQTFLFLAAHIRHHEFQLDRIRSSMPDAMCAD